MFYEVGNNKLSRTILKTRRKILESSYRLFCSEGIFKTTMVDISEATGITRRTLYNHFNTKEEISLLLHRLLLKDILNHCESINNFNKISIDNLKQCMCNLFNEITGDKDRLSYIVNFDQYAQEHHDLFNEEDLFVQFLLNNSSMVEFLETFKNNGFFSDNSISPELLAKVYFESLIAFMERVSFRERTIVEEGMYIQSDFEMLIDILLSVLCEGVNSGS